MLRRQPDRAVAPGGTGVSLPMAVPCWQGGQDARAPRDKQPARFFEPIGGFLRSVGFSSAAPIPFLPRVGVLSVGTPTCRPLAHSYITSRGILMKSKSRTSLRPVDPRLSRADYERRRTELLKRVKPNSVVIVVSNPECTRSNDTEYPYRQSSDVLYLSGFPEPESALVLTNCNRKPRFIMFVRPKDRTQEIWTGIRSGVEGAKRDYAADEAYTVDKFAEVVAGLIKGADNVYYKFERNKEFDRAFKRIWQGKQKSLTNPEDVIHEMRLFKSASELSVMRRAAAISAAAHCYAMRTSRPGLHEYQLQAVLECSFTQQGASGTAYNSIVAGGNNACVLHYTTNRDQLKDGDLVLIDAACEYEGYASDITRTFPVSGKFSKAQRAVYQVVLDAQLAAIKAARPGVPLAQVHLTAQVELCRGLVRLGILPESASSGKYLEKYGKGKYGGKHPKLHLNDLFMHGTSHWIGLDVHDVGSYDTADGTRSDKGKGKQRILEPGMVITVEPGLYFDKNDKRVPKEYRGIGIRIEDDVAITAEGNEVLTFGVPKGVREIEEFMEGGCLSRRGAEGKAPQQSEADDIWIGER